MVAPITAVIIFSAVMWRFRKIGPSPQPFPRRGEGAVLLSIVMLNYCDRKIQSFNVRGLLNNPSRFPNLYFRAAG
jgi:hypothetical protein